MMKKSLLLLFVLGSFGILAGEPTEKEKVAASIYKRLFSALGTNIDAPEFVFDSRRERQIAYMSKNSSGDPIIAIEEKAYEVCMQMGDRAEDAIALLLGHEISHFVNNHHWGKEFRSAYSLGELEKDIKNLDKESAKKFETEADERGGILCFMAGFKTSGIAEELLRKLYVAYEIQESPKYPSLDERIQIAKAQDSLVQTYIKVFETSNYAMLVNEFDVAIDGYEYILNHKFYSREIYNNLGTAYFLKGVSLADQEDLKYLYPVEIDLESKLESMGSKGFGDDVKELFEKALKKFEQAVGFDKNYATGYLNQACAYNVLSMHDDAMDMARKAMRVAKKADQQSTYDNAELVYALANFDSEDGDKEEAEEIMEKLVENGHLLAEVNQLLLEGDELTEIEFEALPIAWMDSKSKAKAGPAMAESEMLSDVEYYTVEHLSTLLGDVEQIKISKSNAVISGEQENTKVYITKNSRGKYMMFHRTKDTYSDKSAQGVKLGDNKDKVLSAYGSPKVVVNTKQGLILGYPDSELMILLNDDKVDALIVYRLEIQTR